MTTVTEPTPASTSNGLGYAGAPVASTSKSTNTAGDLNIKIEFGGGLHLLFANQPSHTVSLPCRISEDGKEERPTDMRYLIKWMKGTILSEREEMFGDGEGVRPGILVLINDADWELEGELDYELQDKDEVVFISTLHGG